MRPEKKKKKTNTFSVSGFLHKLNKNKLTVAEGSMRVRENEGVWDEHARTAGLK